MMEAEHNNLFCLIITFANSQKILSPTNETYNSCLTLRNFLSLQKVGIYTVANKVSTPNFNFPLI